MVRLTVDANRTDNLSKADRKRAMQRVHSTDTTPELRVRRLLFSLGYRYRLHGTALPGKPDVVFPSRKKAVFVHGCFWHGHDCKSGRKAPQTNAEYWHTKLAKTRARDVANVESLSELGWKVLIIWECESRDSVALESSLRAFLDS